MIRQEASPVVPAIPVDETDLKDGSMRLIEYGLAFVALLVAAVLALAR